MVILCSEVAMTDAEKESEARCKEMLNQLIAVGKKQTLEIEELAESMKELAAGLKTVVQPPGATAHALSPPVTAPTATLAAAVDHAVAAATPQAEAALAPELPTRCSMIRAGDDTASQTSAFMPDAAPGPPSTTTLLDVAITSLEPSVATLLVSDDTSVLTSTPSDSAFHSIYLGDEHVPKLCCCQWGAHKPFDEMPIRSTVVLWLPPMKWDEQQLWPPPPRVEIECSCEELRLTPWPQITCNRVGLQIKSPWPPPEQDGAVGSAAQQSTPWPSLKCYWNVIPPDWQDFVGIITLLVINSTIRFIEESNASNAAAALMAGLAAKAKVLRDGRWTEEEAAILVPGDIVSIKLGDIIPADAHLLEGDPLKIDQYVLTGESLPVTKGPSDGVYSGSTVKQGEIEAIEIATGVHTVIGKAAHLVDSTNQVGQFQKVLTAIGNFCICSIAVGMFVEIIVMYPNQHRAYCPGIDNLLVLLIGGIPIAMPIVLSMTMAIGSHRLSQQGAITKRMTAMEEMAGMDVLCSDKTGTLTMNKFTVVLRFCGVLPLIKKPWNCLQNGPSFGSEGGQYADSNDHLKAPGKIRSVIFNSFEGTPDVFDTILDQCIDKLLVVQNSSIQHEWISLVLISGAAIPLDDSKGMILNTMISGYVQCGMLGEAMVLFQQMPNKDMVSWNTMIADYAQDGQMRKAVNTFMKMNRRNTVSWNSIISGFVQNGLFVEALRHFMLMRRDAKRADWSTFACSLSASANLAALQVGRQFHSLLARSGHISDSFAGNALISTYAKCGRILETRQVFDEMAGQDIVTWKVAPALDAGCTAVLKPSDLASVTCFELLKWCLVDDPYWPVIKDILQVRRYSTGSSYIYYSKSPYIFESNVSTEEIYLEEHTEDSDNFDNASTKSRTANQEDVSVSASGTSFLEISGFFDSKLFKTRNTKTEDNVPDRNMERSISRLTRRRMHKLAEVIPEDSEVQEGADSIVHFPAHPTKAGAEVEKLHPVVTEDHTNSSDLGSLWKAIPHESRAITNVGTDHDAMASSVLTRRRGSKKGKDASAVADTPAIRSSNMVTQKHLDKKNGIAIPATASTNATPSSKDVTKKSAGVIGSSLIHGGLQTVSVAESDQGLHSSLPHSERRLGKERKEVSDFVKDATSISAAESSRPHSKKVQYTVDVAVKSKLGDGLFTPSVTELPVPWDLGGYFASTWGQAEIRGGRNVTDWVKYWADDQVPLMGRGGRGLS